MRIIRITALALPVAMGLAVSAGWAQGFGSATPERYFRVEAEGGQGRGGRPVVRGYVYNDNAKAGERVQLAVESLDAAGQAISRSALPLDGVVPAFNRLYSTSGSPRLGRATASACTTTEWLKGGGGSAGLPPGGTCGASLEVFHKDAQDVNAWCAQHMEPKKRAGECSTSGVFIWSSSVQLTLPAA